MTEFEQLLHELNFSNLVSMTVKELETILLAIYKYCVKKYGPVKGNYFTESWSANNSIKRGNEGLDVHHGYEYDPDNSEVCSLSHKETAMMWYDQGYTNYQLAEYLFYCNWIEHQAIHAIIDTLRTRQYGAYRPGCIERRAPMLNRFYNNQKAYLNMLEGKGVYFTAAFTAILSEAETYYMIMDAWAEANEIDDWLIFGYELDSLENCFDVYYEAEQEELDIEI